MHWHVACLISGDPFGRNKEEKMNKIKLIDAETIETSSTFNFADGEVTVVEREVHELYALKPFRSTRLIIDDTIERTKSFIAKSRSEIFDLSSVMRDLTVK